MARRGTIGGATQPRALLTHGLMFYLDGSLPPRPPAPGTVGGDCSVEWVADRKSIITPSPVAAGKRLRGVKPNRSVN